MGMLEEDCEVGVLSYSEDHKIKILIIFVLLLVHSLAFSFSYVLLPIPLLLYLVSDIMLHVLPLRNFGMISWKHYLKGCGNTHLAFLLVKGIRLFFKYV